MSSSGQLAHAAIAIDPVDACYYLLGGTIESSTVEGTVAARVVEVEAYRGRDDPASHSYRGKTARNSVMWGAAGHLYVYFIYGMHYCANVVCLAEGEPGAVLLRAGEIIEGRELAGLRRPRARWDHELGAGPARLTAALGLDREHNGSDLTDPASPVRFFPEAGIPTGQVSTGPRVGVTAAAATPWRFWLSSSRAVSAYRRGGKRRESR